MRRRAGQRAAVVKMGNIWSGWFALEAKFAGGSGKGKRQGTVYEWKIKGFSSLQRLRGGEGLDIFSGLFVAGGYKWVLHMMTTKSEDGAVYMCLQLRLITILSHSSKVKAEYNFIIYHQLLNKHIKESGVSEFMSGSYDGEFHYMIPLEMFKDASSGFLINDSFFIGVEIVRVVDTSECKVVLDSMSLSKGTPSHVSYTRNIGISQKLRTSTDAFYAGGLKWHIIFCVVEGKHLSIYLRLDYWDSIRLESGIYVEFNLCLKDQIEGKHAKKRLYADLNSKSRIIGWQKFMSCEELYDRSNGFVVYQKCNFEASVTVLGSVNYSV